MLRAQEYSDWSAPLSLKLFNQVLSFVTHTKPKIRKAAQHAIASIIHGCCFMAPQKSLNDEESDETISKLTVENNNKVLYHPAGSFVAKFCIEQFKAENITKSQTIVLHTLALLRDTLNGLRGDDIKDICENLLSIMTASKVMIQTNCFHTLHALFASKSPNLTASLVGKLIAAIYDYRPERSDVRQTLAWLTVLKQGHICLASIDLTMCINALPRFIDICAGDIWMSENNQIASGASNTLKELLLECIKPAGETEQLSNVHRKPITRILNAIAKGLTAPFGHVSQQVVLVFATVFEVAGRNFKETLQNPLNAIAARYDEQASSRLQIEHTLLSAIGTMGPEAVLKAVPLTDGKGAICLSRSWILPLLREAINHSTFDFFNKNILPLANKCHELWQRNKAEEKLSLAHTHELLYCQLWGLFPGFCRNPVDIGNFRIIAKTLGDALKTKVEIRLPILDGLKELLLNADDECKQQLARFAKNFLTCLLNIYSTKPSGSYENDIRANTMDVIREYLKVTSDQTLVELFNTAKLKFESMGRVEIILKRVQELNVSLERDDEEHRQFDEAERTRIKEAYEFLENLLEGKNELGVEYVQAADNEDEIKDKLRIVPPRRVQQLFKHIKWLLGPFVYESYFDIIVSLAVYQSAEQLKQLFDDYISPTLRNAKEGGVTRLIKERQSKSYELLKNILLSETTGCTTFVNGNVRQIQNLLLGTLQNRKNSSQVARLT